MTVLRLGSLLFRLHPGALLITLLAISVLVKLGFWQIERGQEKQHIIDRHAAAAQFIPINHDTLTSLANMPESLVEFHGTLDTERYFLVDNQIHQARVGYQVLALATNSAIAPSKVVVNLGWVAGTSNRDILPEVRLPAESLHLYGRVRVPADRPFLLVEQQFSDQDGWPMRIQYPELDKLQQQLQLPLSDFMLLQDEQANFGFVREWPVVVMPPQRHYAYAMQWFGLAIAALAVFLFASREQKNPKQEERP